MTGALPTSADTLTETRPIGFTPLGWADVAPETRVRCIVRQLPERLEGAANALLGQTMHMEESRRSAVLFVAETLLDQAHLLRRALAVQAATDDAQPATPVQSRAPKSRARKGASRKGGAPS